MQKARHHDIRRSDRLQAYGFRVYCTPFFKVLFTFPSRYLFTIGLCRVFSLGGWARRFQSGFLVPRSTQDTARLINLTSTGLSPSMDILSRIFLFSLFRHVAVLQPRSRRNGYGLGCADFARHYSRYHFCFLFLLLLRCFSSEGLLLF